MQHGHFIVVLENAVAERLENSPDAAHAVAVQLRRANA
jgi:hypothetical protein